MSSGSTVRFKNCILISTVTELCLSFSGMVNGLRGLDHTNNNKQHGHRRPEDNNLSPISRMLLSVDRLTALNADLWCRVKLELQTSPYSTPYLMEFSLLNYNIFLFSHLCFGHGKMLQCDWSLIRLFQTVAELLTVNFVAVSIISSTLSCPKLFLSNPTTTTTNVLKYIIHTYPENNLLASLNTPFLNHQLCQIW